MNALFKAFTYSAGIVILLVIVFAVLFFSWPKIAGWWMDSPVTDLVDLQCEQHGPWHFPYVLNLEESLDSTRVCLAGKDLVEINKAVRISDAISLLGILVAVAALLFPVLGFITLNRERVVLKNKIKELSAQSEKRIIGRTDEFQDKLIATIEGYWQRLAQYPRMLALAQAVGAAYLQERMEGDGAEVESEDGRMGRLRSLPDYLQQSRDIEASLIELLDDPIFEDAIGRIESYIAPEDVENNTQFIIDLKYYLRALYQNNLVDTEVKRAALKQFVEDKLRLRVSEMMGSPDE